MLILTRKKGETIVIGDDIRITVMQVDRGANVRIGIEAPNSVKVDRQEIRERKDRDAVAV